MQKSLWLMLYDADMGWTISEKVSRWTMFDPTCVFSRSCTVIQVAILSLSLSWVFQIWPMTLDLWLDLRDSIQLIFSKLHGCARVRLQMTFRGETPRQFTWRQGVLEWISGKRQFKMFKFSVIPGFGHIVSLLANIFHLACYCPVVQKCALISICERNSFSRVMTKRSLRASSRISKRPISVEELHHSSRVNTYLHDVYIYIITYWHIFILCIYIWTCIYIYYTYVCIVCFDIVNIMASHFSR